VEDPYVVLRKLDGVEVKAPKDNLSFPDLEYLGAIDETKVDSGAHTDSESSEADEVERIAASLWLNTVSTSIERYVFDSGKYWFQIEVLLDNGRTWKLARKYEDFYDLQIALLAEFPVESGSTGHQKRILPFLPGPVSFVTDAIAEGRMYNLDSYLKNLSKVRPRISKCTLVQEFFVPKDDDKEIDAPEDDDEEIEAIAPAGGSADSPGQVRQVLLDFKPVMDDEMEVHVGELVRLIHEYDDGWVSKLVSTK
jgi:hypothetical protein